MRLHTDMLPDGELITALVQRGPDVCAFSQRGCVSLLPGMIKLEYELPLEKLTPALPLPTIEA